MLRLGKWSIPLTDLKAHPNPPCLNDTGSSREEQHPNNGQGVLWAWLFLLDTPMHRPWEMGVSLTQMLATPATTSAVQRLTSVQKSINTGRHNKCIWETSAGTRTLHMTLEVCGHLGRNEGKPGTLWGSLDGTPSVPGVLSLKLSGGVCLWLHSFGLVAILWAQQFLLLPTLSVSSGSFATLMAPLTLKAFC